jgi:hypothetical protein
VKRVGRIALGAAVALAAGYGVLAVAVGTAPYPAVAVGPGPAPGPVMGFWHIHGEESHDGFGTIEEAAAAAAELGGRFLVVTEHNRLRPELPAVEHGVVLVPGLEISAHHGHVVALGLDRKVGRGEDVLARIAEAGGEAVIAHPTNLHRPWNDPAVDGFAGWEAWSLDSEWRKRLHRPGLPLLLAGAALAGDSRKAGALLLGDPAEDLGAYDRLAARRPVSLLCAVDAHGLPPYRTSFGALAIHVDVGSRAAAFGADPAADAAAVREAIVGGRLFCSVPALGDASSFSFRREGGEVVASVAVPGADVRILRDGEAVGQGAGQARVPADRPGAYRAEVRLSPGFPWPDPSLWIVASPLRIPAVPPGGGSPGPAEPAEPPVPAASR